LLQNFIKMTYAKPRDEELETETEILRDRDETWDLRDRDSENGSRDTSRHRDQVSRLYHCLFPLLTFAHNNIKWKEIMYHAYYNYME